MTKEEFLALAGSRYEALQELKKLDDFYDYEKGFEKIMQDLGREVLEQNIGSVPKDRRKKKL
jgi:uncharacterized membrane protein